MGEVEVGLRIPHHGGGASIVPTYKVLALPKMDLQAWL